MATLAAGVAGVMLAGAQATPAPAGTAITTRASATYVPSGYTQTETVSSNALVLVVGAVEALTLTQSQSLTRPPGASITLSHMLTNVGNTPSSYTFGLTSNGAGCASTTFNLSGLQLVRDSNNNGVADPADPVLPLGQTGVLTLQPGEIATLLVRGNVPSVASGTACLALSAVTTLQALTAVNEDIVTLGSAGQLVLATSASYGGLVLPGVSDISFTINGSSIGAQDVLPTATAAAVGTAVTVDGAPMALVLVRDIVPVGAVYNPNSLQTSVVGALKLYRTVSDTAFAYHQGDGGGNATEVAIGIPAVVARNSALTMSFSVRVSALFTGNIVDSAQSFFNDGINAVQSASNTVVIATTPATIGLAKAAGIVRANVDSSGQSDGTASVTFSLRVKNYGAVPLYGVQIADVMEGSGATQFGSYTTQTVPGTNQYTVVAGSSAVVNNQGGGTTGMPPAVDPTFTGQAGTPSLLAAGAVLPVGGEFTVVFDLRVNISGRTTTLLNTATATATVVAGGPVSVRDVSTNGINPDPGGYGNPGSSSVVTPVAVQLPVVSVSQTISVPRRVSEGVFDLDYIFKVANKGTASAPNVRILTNLNCTFNMDLTTGAIASWQVVSAPTAQNGVLQGASTFNGATACDRAALASNAVPQGANLSVVDGSRALGAGQSDVITFTVRVTKKTQSSTQRVSFTNMAWVVSLQTNGINQSPSSVAASASSSEAFFLIDPTGVVYNSLTRQPVAGAVVTFTRTACSASVATPIVAAEIQGANTPGLYTFNANGSMSMTTGADGTYQFFFNSPPVVDVCTYTLSVAAPAGSAYVVPSVLIPAQAGSFSSCGAVVPNAFAPMGSDPTTYYNTVRAGLFPGTSTFCEVLYNHFPLDPGNVNGLSLKKEGSKTQAEFGDFVDYALTVTNKTNMAITGLSLTDFLPPGLAYVARSARLNGQATPDPTGGSGPTVVFSYPSMTLAVNAAAVVHYRARIGVGAPTQGDVVNRALANSGAMQSNAASFKTRVSGGVFADDAYAFGKVYMDCRHSASAEPAAEGDGPEQADDMGVPGVRLYLENGTHVVTDAQGKWSLYGLKPVTHVLRLDQTTLPAGAVLGILDNRNSGTPESRFIDLKKGEFHRADFVVTNCGDTAMRAEVTARRKALATRSDSDSEARARVRLDPENRFVVPGDTRALPASNVAVAGGAGGLGVTVAPLSTSTSLIELPAAPLGAGAMALPGPPGSGPFVPLVSASPMPHLAPAVMEAPASEPSPPASLEEVLPQLDAAWDFIGLTDGSVVPSQVINVRLKGELDHSLRLSVNGEVIDERRVGKKAVLESKKMVAWEYIGVALKPGINTLVLDAVDSFGLVRASKTIHVTAPDKLARIEIDLPALARADMRTPVLIGVRLTDANGVPVTARTAVTLETDRGQWLDTDLSPSEPGHQVFIEGGSGEFHLQPPGEPGDARVRVSANTLVKEVRLTLLPEIRPMIGVGVVEGVLDFTRRGALTLGAMPAGAAFETELTGLHTDGSGPRAAARSAFFFKGTVKGDYLLTAAFDSDKSSQDRLFRDIRPDEFYPVYGDASVKGYDAQSSQRLYVRIDQNRSYLLYGDFTTTSSAEVRQLSQSSRTLTGIKNVYDNNGLRATSYAARTAQTQQVEEFPSVGTSGPYFLSATGGDLVLNSEVVTVIVRDRHQPGLVLSATPMARLSDYTLEAFTRRLLFTHAIASVDSNLNPQSIRVTYEADSGGAQFLVAGTDVQVKVTDHLQLGVVSSVDENPDNRRKLSAVTALARLGESVTASAEAVHTETALNNTGFAARAELRQQTDRLSVLVMGSKTSEGFDNPGASVSAGRTDAGARAEYKLDDTTTVRGEAVYGKALVTPEQSRLSASLQKKFTDTLTGEIGLNRGQTAGASAGFNYGQTASYNAVSGVSSSTLGSGIGAASITALASSVTAPMVTTVRSRLTTEVPGVPQAQVFVEGEQALDRTNGHTLAVGGNYAITDKTRAYGRYELVSTLDHTGDLTATQPNNTGIVGVESTYMEGGRVYNEYRMSDTPGVSPLLAAMGVRNAIKITDQIKVTAGVEQTKSIGNSNTANTGTGLVGGVGNSTAVISGAEYMTERIKLSGIGEVRHGSDADTYLVSAGFGYKIDADWSLLARSVVTDSQGQGVNLGNDRRLLRNQLGVALRPAGQDVWNALARYEHKLERVEANGLAVAAPSITALGGVSAPGTYSTDIISANLNVNPARGNYITARYAGKISRADDGFLASRYWANLLQGRYTRDLAPDWDAGVQAGVLYGQGGALQRTLGLEVGYQAARNIWVSVGYNVVGLSDRDLTAGEYTSKGAYVRLRFKFDENTLGLGTRVAGDEVHIVPAAAVSVRPAVDAVWKPGRGLPARVVLTESQLFVPGQEELSPAGEVLLRQLGDELGAPAIGEIDVTAYVPATDESNLLWLGRAATVRRVLQAYGPRAISIATDTQALPARPRTDTGAPAAASDAAAKTVPTLQVALVKN